MALKTIDQNPKITDTILFEIETPDADGCFKVNPYKVDTLTIYMVERDFMGTNYGEYDQAYDRPDLVALVAETTRAVCDDPSVANVAAAQAARNALESTRTTSKFYYKDRIVVKVVGSSDYPAWLSTDTTNADLVNVPLDDEGNPQYGHFTYEWTPDGSVREGDYFVCWTWTPNFAGESLSAHLPFKMDGDGRAVITIPTHLTATDKYETLLERYLPEMYKSTLAEKDITPQALDLLNQSVARGFTFLEDQANQIIDLFDANALHESLLMYLSNLFNLKLKSSDPTLWRRQIKAAVPLFKQKGTRPGIEAAFAQAGMTLNSFTQFWQVVSPYTWQESFKVVDTPIFALAKENVVLPIDEANFGLWVRRDGEADYVAVSSDCVEFTLGENLVWTMTWVGDQLPVPVDIYEGDIIRVLYQYDVITPAEQTLEDYIRALPVGDLRDETDQDYPPKNWNVKLIAEDDPLFDILVPVRHPYYDWLIFGYLRTEFAYSENIYNMDEYNGSIRPSNDPCFIDKSFIDPCGACLSSYYAVDVGVEELNNDRLSEVQDILREHMPFHAQLYALNFSGEVNEFIPSPVEEIETLVTIDHTETTLSGQANPFFHRVMEGGLSNWIIDRSDLANKQTVLSGKIGTAYNDYIAIVCVAHRFDHLGVINVHNVLEVLAPSPNAGTYTITQINGHVAECAPGVPEPVDESAFTFNLSNVLYSNWFTSITQDNLYKLSDSGVDYSFESVKSDWDVNNTPDYTGGAWKVYIPALSATPYTIRDVQNGVLVLNDHDDTLAAGTDISYTLLTDLDEVITTSVTGVVTMEQRGYVNLNDIGIVSIEELVHAGDYLRYNTDEFEITTFDGNNFWIAGWTAGDMAGATINIRRRLLTNETGYFGYYGLNLITFSDHEAEFQIVDGSNPPADPTDDNHFKENYMFLINGTFFRILEWNGQNVKLAGREQNWQTLGAGGTVVAYAIVWFPTKEVNVQFLVFDHLDRDGDDVIEREIEDSITHTTAIVALSNNASSGLEENVSHEESISFIIEKRDGSTTSGEL